MIQPDAARVSNGANRTSLSQLPLALSCLLFYLATALSTHAALGVYTSDANGSLLSAQSTTTIAPSILAQPVSQVVVPGGNAGFSILAQGSQPLTFQWELNRVPISGATSDSLFVSNVSRADEGAYRVVVTSGASSVTSSEALLFLDSDQDGLPDSWEISYFGSLTNQTASGDRDLDGVLNGDEFREGTNPTNATSLLPRLQVSTVGPGSVTVSPLAPTYTVGQQVSLTAIPSSGSAFIGWSGDLDGSANPAVVTLSRSKKISALFGLPLAIALDTTNLVWSSGGSAGWLGQTVITHDGVDAAQSGPLREGEESWLETTVTNTLPVGLDFWWRISGTAGPKGTDTLEFWINGKEQPGQLQGTATWQSQSHALPPGTNVLRWRFAKFSTSTRYADVHNGGFLDQISFRPLAAISIANASVVEGNTGNRDALFTLTLKEPVAQAATVNYFTTNQTAIAGSDYVSRSGVITIAAGLTLVTVPVPVLGDLLQEGDETFGIVLYRPSNGFIVKPEAVATIHDDEIAPVALTLVQEECAPGNGAIDPGEQVTVNISLRNPGPLPTQRLRATLLANAAVTSPSAPMDYGAIPSDTIVSRNFSFIANGPCGSNATATLRLEDQGNVIGEVAFTFTLGNVSIGNYSFSTTTPISLPARGNGDPYGSSNIVSGVTGTVQRVSVTLHGLTHPNPDDLDLLLVSPTGKTLLLMSDAGGAADLSSIDLTLDGAAPTGLPDNSQILSGRFLPTNFDTNTDTFAAPAPAGPYGQSLSSFAGLNPNGAWRLFAVDDANSNAGSIAGGWTLEFNTFDASCCTGVGQADLALRLEPEPAVVVGHEVALICTVTNLSAVPAGGVKLTNTLPASLVYVSSTPSQGTSSFGAGTVSANLGTLPPRGSATLRIVARTTLPGSFPVSGQVSLDSRDPDTANNSATADLVGLLPQLSISDVTVNDTATNAVFTVSLSALTSLEVTVRYLTTNATALAGEDYTATNGLLRFPPNITNQTIRVPILGDAISEANETFQVRLFAPTNATLLDGTGVGTITDDDQLPSILVSDVQVVEGQRGTANAVFTLTLSSPSGQSATVRYATVNGTATAPADYTARSGTLTFAAGVTTGLVTVPIVGDVMLEGDETFGLQLSSPVRATLSDPLPICTILDDEFVADGFTVDQESCDPANGQVDPGETVRMTFRFRNPGPLDATNLTIRLSANSELLDPDGPIAIDVAPGDNSSVGASFSFQANGWCGSNLVATITFLEGTNSRGTLSYEFLMGSTTATTNTFAVTQPILVPASGPGSPYGSTNRVSGVVGTVSGISVTLSNLFHTNPDHLDLLLVGPGGEAVMLLSDAGGSVDVTNLTVRIQDWASGFAPDSTALLNTAYRPSDYQSGDSLPAPAPQAPYAGTLAAFNGLNPNGEWKLYVTDDSNNESGGLLGGWSLTVYTFDAECCIDAGASDLALSMTAPPQPVVVGHDLVFTVIATNPAPIDATGVTVTNRLPANATFVSARGSQGDCVQNGDQVICVLGDIPAQSSATVLITVAPSRPGSYTNSASLTGARLDPNSFNNSAVAVGSAVVPAIQVTDISATEADGPGAEAVFQIVLSAFSSQTVSLRYVTGNGTALAGSDYVAASGLVVFPPRSTLQEVRIPLVGDLINELNETFTLTLSNPTNATLAVTRATATIVENDPLPEISIQDTSVFEGDTGTTNVVFELILSRPSSRSVSVAVATANGTATAGTDYTARSATVTWSAGTLSQLFTASVRGDALIESNETFRVTLSRPVNATTPVLSATATILDDDLRILGAKLTGGGAVLISFRSQTGRSYALERARSLQPGATWESTPGATLIIGTGAIIEVSDPSGGGLEQRFYRLRLLP